MMEEEQMLELVKAMQEQMETQIDSLASKMDANQAGMKAVQEQMDANQAKADANMKTNQEILAGMEAKTGITVKEMKGQDGSHDKGQ
jgi:hypothetical protein